jgi:2-(1,2-epoxy-1,2-dihydrophenyl)acetyl-CoA isomerase
MSFETIKYAVEGNVGVITFNRPEVANAMSPLCAKEFNDVSLEVEGDANVRAVVLTGAGKMFCAGGDLGEFSAAGAGARSLILKMTGDLHLGLSRLARNAAPVIGAINGTAAGAGFSLVMACDLAVSAQSAVYTMAYTNAGLSPDGSST